jgi:hypothetical protein
MTHNIRHNQSGIVAIVVTMIMMLVITLIVLGFTQATSRNQREALDSQLGTQAYYAAETGVNDAVNYITANPGTAQISTCKNLLLPPRKLKADKSVAYTCLMVNPNPTSLVLDGVDTTASKQWHVQNGAGINFGSLTFEWTPTPGGGPATCSSIIGKYPPHNTWTSNCSYPILRVDITKAPIASYDAASLANNTTTLFLQPGGSGGSAATVSSFGPKKAYQAPCAIISTSDGVVCSAKVSLALAAQSSEYYIRLTTIYESTASVTLRGTNITPGGPVSTFTKGQYVIDSTGRAQDQLKRIQVRVPYKLNSSGTPTYALQSTDTICKDLSVSATMYDKGACGGLWPNFSGGSFACSQPDDITLVLDASNSMNYQWETDTREAKLKEIAITFLSKVNLGATTNHIGIISFHSSPILESNLSSDQAQLTSAINGIVNQGGTNYIDALGAANTQLTGGRVGVKKVMVFISDGQPDTPGNDPASIDAVANAMKTQGVEIYTIGITVQGASAATAILSSMAGNGGAYYSAASEAELQQFFDDIATAQQC